MMIFRDASCVGLFLILFPSTGAAQQEEAGAILDKTEVKGGGVVHIGCSDGKLTAALSCRAFSPLSAFSSDADEIYKETGFTGGLVVLVGCGGGTLAADLYREKGVLVLALDADAGNVEKARQHIRSKGIYGRVSVDRLAGNALPLIDNTVNLLVSEDLGNVSMEEVMRVLAPGGIASIGRGASRKNTMKPRPKGIDDWTHYLHGPDNNAVATDRVVDMPFHFQWTGAPRWARAHEHLATVSAVVSSGGRIFSIIDEGNTSTVYLPARWRLVARDAFNGVVLWKRVIETWEDHLRGFRIGPAYLPRGLVAVGNRVYAYLGYDQCVTALDAATGKTVLTYAGTEGAREIVVDGTRLFIVVHEASEETETAPRSLGIPKKRLLVFDAGSGKRLWEKKGGDAKDFRRVTLAASGDIAVYQIGKTLVCVDAGTGVERWRAERKDAVAHHDAVNPTTVLQDGHVLWAEYPPREKGKEPPAPGGELIVYEASSGKELWRALACDDFRSPIEVFVIGGVVWTRYREGKDVGHAVGRDLRTGKVLHKLPPDQELFHVAGHGWCYRNKATERFLLRARGGIDFISVTSGPSASFQFIRGTCQYGIMPANGLIYTPPHACNCYIYGKLNGFSAYAPKRARSARPSPSFEKGPAYDAVQKAWPDEAAAASDWPTFRGSALRTGFVDVEIRTGSGTKWEASLGGRVTPPVVARGRVFVAQIDGHSVHALDSESGKELWSFTAGGRVDSPPTLHRGLALFGSADGWVYALRASDGELAWRFRAAPGDQRLVSYGQVESVWPVPGSVLVVGDAVCFVAGRSSFLDGGIRFYRLDARSGKKLSESILYHRDPETGKVDPKILEGKDVDGALPDVLASDGKSIFMRHNRLDIEGRLQERNVPHVFSSVGFVDPDWWHRTYQQFGVEAKSGFGGWASTGNAVAAGRLIVTDGKRVYGFGRTGPYGNGISYAGITTFRLFRSAPQPEMKKVDVAGKKRKGFVKQYDWEIDVGVRARGMVLAGKTLYLAGPPNPLLGRSKMRAEQRSEKKSIQDKVKKFMAEHEDTFLGRNGGLIWAVAAPDGKKLDEWKLEAPPVHDGLIAADGALFLSTVDGKVVRFE